MPEYLSVGIVEYNEAGNVRWNYADIVARKQARELGIEYYRWRQERELEPSQKFQDLVGMYYQQVMSRKGRKMPMLLELQIRE